MRSIAIWHCEQKMERNWKQNCRYADSIKGQWGLCWWRRQWRRRLLWSSNVKHGIVVDLKWLHALHSASIVTSRRAPAGFISRGRRCDSISSGAYFRPHSL